jgi:glucosylglycerate synthase
VATETLPDEIRSRVTELGRADTVVAFTIPAFGSDGTPSPLARTGEAVAQLGSGGITVLVHAGGAVAAGDSVGGSIRLLPFPAGVADQVPRLGLDAGQTYRTVFTVSQALGARACLVIGSDPAALSAHALRGLAQPVLEGTADLVTPVYRRGRYEGLLNVAVVAPLFRALYGCRVRFPIGGDFGLSGALVARCLRPAAGPRGESVWLTSEAACAGMQLAQAQLGVGFPARREPGDASAVLAAVLGPVFQDVANRAACWQRSRESRGVPTLGPLNPPPPDTPAPDAARMIESFRIGYANLQDVWRTFLPPATLLELKRLTALGPDAFRMGDESWARIVYDSALAYRLGTLSRDHVLGALTPLYLAWIASYTREARGASEPVLAARMERLGAAYESQKPYFVSRWRWPDRFNP